MTSPYRENALTPGSRPPPPEPPPRDRLEDGALALILLIVGTLGIAVGLRCGRGLELALGILLIAAAAKVGREARS